jgi:hypothetical protein
VHSETKHADYHILYCERALFKSYALLSVHATPCTLNHTTQEIMVCCECTLKQSRREISMQAAQSAKKRNI